MELHNKELRDYVAIAFYSIYFIIELFLYFIIELLLNFVFLI